MIKSMTGFGSKELEAAPFGKICVELRSANHKFLDIVVHLPAGFLFLEDTIRRQIATRIKRGRIVCVVNIIGGQSPAVYINQGLLRNYIKALKQIKRQFQIKDNPSLDTLINLPRVLSLAETKVPESKIWPALKKLMRLVLDDLVKARQKEGRALSAYLKTRARALSSNLEFIKTRFRKVIKEKVEKMSIDEERVTFLKNTDITEEMERLVFHIQNFTRKLSQGGPLGKELDFIAQEMQRETNTIGAKSCDKLISARVVQLKSQIEKIREQTQNIE